MKIKGRVYHIDDTDEAHKALKANLKLLMESTFVAPTTDSDADGVECDAIEISEMNLKCERNPRGVLTCVTLTKVDIDQDVANALAESLGQILGVPCLIYTPPSGRRLIHHDDYQLRLDAAVLS